MIEKAAVRLSELTGQEFFVYRDTITTSLTVNDDWDRLFESLTEHCRTEDWNGAFVPGISAFFNHPDGKDVKIYPVSVVYCGSCCG